MSFLPKDFIVPALLETDLFRLRPLTVNDVVKDYDAVMSSHDHLRAMFGAVWGGWPTGLTLEQDLIDLGWHQKEFQARSSFAYTVVSLDEARVLGCVYVDASRHPHYDAVVCLWVRQDELVNGLDEALFAVVKQWIATEWPFQRVAYPGREINWTALDAYDPVADVLATEKAWTEAHRNGDFATIADLMAEEYVRINPDGSLSNRAQTLAAYQPETRHWDFAQGNEYDVRINGDNAVVVGRWTARGVNDGQPFDYQARFLSIYVRRNGRWLMAAEQSTEMKTGRLGLDMDLILRNATLLDGTQADIAIRGERIVAISPNLVDRAATEIDAEHRLLLPAFVNGQLHACKVFWRRKLATLPPEVQRLPRFQAAKQVKHTYTVEDVAARVGEVMRLALLNGTCAIRLFADVDDDSGLTALQGLLQVKAQFSPLLTVQVVAFPQDGVLGAHTQSLMQQALELGADVVGGIPWIEPAESARRAHTRMCFDLARRFDKDLHFVCDDALDPTLRTLEDVAQQTIEQGYHGRVAATQCAALAAYDDGYAAQVIDLVRQAGITVFANSHVSLITTEATNEPLPRGVTRIRQLLAAGVPVACAQDDIDNWYYAFGRNDMLEVAHFMAHNGQFAWDGAVNQVLPMVTDVPARVLGLADYGLQVGAVANLVLLDASDWHQALQFQVDKRLVVLRGRVVAETERHSRLWV